MTLHTISVFLTQGLIVWCLRLDANAKRDLVGSRLADRLSAHQLNSINSSSPSLVPNREPDAVSVANPVGEDVAPAAKRAKMFGPEDSAVWKVSANITAPVEASALSASLQSEENPPAPVEYSDAAVVSRPADQTLAHQKSTISQDSSPSGSCLEQAAESVAIVAAEDTTPGERAEASAPDHNAVRKQLEYYLSDENLRYDDFIRDKIAGEVDGWLETALLLSCSTIKRMKLTPADVVAALKESNLEVKEGGGFIRRPGNAALPKLETKLETVQKQQSPQRRSPPKKSSKAKDALKADQLDGTKHLDRVYAVLLDHVAYASQPVEYLETAWAPGEVAKRVARYIYNSAKREELRSMNPEDACDELVKFAMSSYEVACGDKEWFFKLDLSPAFAATAWELFKGQPGVKFEVVQAKTRAAFLEYMDTALINKGMWEASSKVFTDAAVHNKVYVALQKAYWLAFEDTIVEVRAGNDLERVRSFLRHWIDYSMTRAWNSVPDAERVLTVKSVSKLFQNLLAPFGQKTKFSTIPQAFTSRIGLPPSNWDFVKREVKALFNSWGLRYRHVPKEEPPPAMPAMGKWNGKVWADVYGLQAFA